MEIRLSIADPEPQLQNLMKAMVLSAGQLSQTEAAALLHLSRSQFSRRFKLLTGRTFRSERLQTKLLIGEQLLRGTQLSVSEIASRLGYQERNKFDRIFKRNYGVTPAQYRGTLDSTSRTTASQDHNISVSEHRRDRTSSDSVTATVGRGK